jgi:hypothetical protein
MDGEKLLVYLKYSKSGGLVKITRNNMNKLIIGLLLLIVFVDGPASGDQVFAPPVLWDRGIVSKTDPIDIANTYLGIAYRDDGALDDQGHFTTFDRPDRLYDTPGLNCSGLVVSVSRFLLNKNWTLEEVTRDRLGDSGENASLGKDWDFGWDLILNLTEGRARKVIMPDGRDYPIEGANGSTLRGFDLHDQAAWQRVLPQMRPGHIYLASISRPARDRGYPVLHYHVVLMLPDSHGGIWLYHATRRSHVHKMNLATAQGMGRFMGEFKNSKGDTKKILIVEAALPQYGPPTETATDKQPKQEQPSAPQTQAPTTANIEPIGGKEGQTGTSAAADDTQPKPQVPAVAAKDQAPELALNHLSGKVFNPMPELLTHIPTFAEDGKTGVRFRFVNRGDNPKQLEIIVKGPDGEMRYKGTIPAQTQDLSVIYPRDFGNASAQPLRIGDYLEEVRVDGAQWCANLFEIARPREALPKIIDVKAPTTVESGKSFTIRVEAQNQGAESDYGGITISCPQSSGLKLVSAKSGRIFGAGSSVLSVTTDKIRTKVPMAERWIELWGENNVYDLTVQVQAGRPGTYPIYIRCALRGVNVKSSVVLMDPASSEVVDQQGFPVYVHQVTVR